VADVLERQAGECVAGEGKSLLFVNKQRRRRRAGKKQKNFIRLEPALSPAGCHVEKVFLLLFFQKKKILAFLPSDLPFRAAPHNIVCTGRTSS
jgi:hypothetical protein